MFLEGEWARSVELYTEALNIAEYAESEDIFISQNLREKLHANRAASYLNIVRICIHMDVQLVFNKGVKLIKNDSRSIYNVTKHFYFKGCSIQFSIH